MLRQLRYAIKSKRLGRKMNYFIRVMHQHTEPWFQWLLYMTMTLNLLITLSDFASSDFHLFYNIKNGELGPSASVMMTSYVLLMTFFWPSWWKVLYPINLTPAISMEEVAELRGEDDVEGPFSDYIPWEHPHQFMNFSTEPRIVFFLHKDIFLFLNTG